MNYSLPAAALCLAGYVWWRIAMARRAEAWEESQRAGYRRRIAEDPKNIGAYEALGDSLHRAGRLEEARDAYLSALDAGSDASVLDKTRYKLRLVDDDLRARAQTQGRRASGRVLRERELEFCAQCGAPNPPQRRHCELCGALLPFDSYWDALRNRELLRASLEGLSILAVVGVVLTVFGFLPLDVKGAILIAAVIVVAWRLLKAIEGQRG